jgi:C1A family cysteine protease
MEPYQPRGFGWLPCPPDFRDYAPAAPPVAELFEQIRSRKPRRDPLDAAVDLREYFVEVDDQLDWPTSSAHACLGLVQYFERRAHGRQLRPSRLFLHQNALRLAGHAPGSDAGIDLRTTLEALIRCGAPPERYWPYQAPQQAAVPDAFLYSFTERYRSIRYLRLDDRKASGRQTLDLVRRFLAAGFPACFGMSIPSSITADGQIAYRPTFDSPLGGQALIAVGYDDRWLRGTRGALLVRSSWGPDWGENGYGWLPYAFVEERLAIDFFTLVHPAWISSGEFDRPQ